MGERKLPSEAPLFLGCGKVGTLDLDRFRFCLWASMFVVEFEESCWPIWAKEVCLGGGTSKDCRMCDFAFCAIKFSNQLLLTYT